MDGGEREKGKATVSHVELSFCYYFIFVASINQSRAESVAQLAIGRRQVSGNLEQFQERTLACLPQGWQKHRSIKRAFLDCQ